VIKEYGADSFRMYEMFMGPLEDSKPWNTDGIKGLRRFLDKNWNYFNNLEILENDSPEIVERNDPKGSLCESSLNIIIKAITDNIENFRFNTSISALMIYFKDLGEWKALTKQEIKELVNPYLIMLSTFAPHISEELWNKLNNKGFICQQEWPEYNEKLIKEDKINLPIQVNGKLRATLEVEKDISEDNLKKQVLELENVNKFIDGKEIVKFIYIKNKIVNIVIK